MPEQAYTPPETKYEVHIDELMKAIRGEPFVQGNGLWRMKGKEIKREKLLGTAYLMLDDNQEYVLLTEAKLKGADALTLQNDTLTDYGIGFIFYKSIIPHTELSNAQVVDWHFYNTQAGNISIKAASRVQNITICTNSIIGYVKINQSEASSISIFENCQVKDISVVRNSKCKEILISDNVIINSIRINRFSQTGDIWIENNTPAISIDINSESQTGKLICLNTNLNFVNIEGNFMDIELANTSILRMTISQSLIGTLNWGAGTKGELYISGQSKILHLPIASASLQKDSVLSLSDTQVRYFVLEEAQIVGSLLLRKISAAPQAFDWRNIATYLDNHPNNEDIWVVMWQGRRELLEQQLEDYQEKVAQLNEKYGESPLFRISHSSLGKTEITGCDFSGFQFQYYNSNLLGCFITGTQLPKRNMVIYDPVTDTVLNNQSHSHALFEQKTAVYNQFKKIYENQGDVVEASVFHAQAMHWQQKLLWRQFRHDKEGFWKKVKLFFENIGFWLNWFSNNHGESWLVALVFTIGVSLVFFTASIWGLTHFWDWKTLNDHIHKLPGFMLPIHKLDFLSEDIIKANPALKVSLWHTTWDFLGRIFIGYGIFQFISAFRRHSKKGG